MPGAGRHTYQKQSTVERLSSRGSLDCVSTVIGVVRLGSSGRPPTNNKACGVCGGNNEWLHNDHYCMQWPHTWLRVRDGGSEASFALTLQVDYQDPC